MTAVGTSFDRLLAGMVAAGQGLEVIGLYLGLTQAAVLASVVRLALPTPSDRPYRRPGPRGWSVLDTQRLIVWRLAGVHPEIIGLRLGRSASAARAKARRLGIPTPPRSSLRRLDPASLADPEQGVFAGLARTGEEPRVCDPAERCGRAAGPVNVRGGLDRLGAATAYSPSKSPAAPSVIALPTAAQPAPLHPIADRGRARLERPPGQRELPLLQVVRPQPKIAPAAPKPAVTAPAAPPRTIEEVDLNADQHWIGAEKRLRSNRVAVWVLGMLYFGGLRWQAIAKRIGKTLGATRSQLSRAGVPRDPNRDKFSDRFDEAAARATLEASGFELAWDGEAGEYFWRNKRDRAKVRRCPSYRRRHGQVERYSRETISLITARDLAQRSIPAPFARPSVMLPA